MNIALITGIAVPVFLFLFIPAVYGIVRMIIRGAQYFVRSEEAQERTATSNEKIAKSLEEYMQITDAKIDDLSKRQTITEVKVERHERVIDAVLLPKGIRHEQT